MKCLRDSGYEYLLHYSPLHYLPFIIRDQRLKSKQALLNEGFPATHFRSKSSRTDCSRGFKNYIHLTLKDTPRILKAKLKQGFPHLEIRIPISSLPHDTQYELCRYNIAMTRRLPSSPMGGFAESDEDGWYRHGLLVPTAHSLHEKIALLQKHRYLGTMIEVLIRDGLALPPDTIIRCFSTHDHDVVRRVHLALNRPLNIEISSETYIANDEYRTATANFLKKSVANPFWKGDGLEFDRV